MIRVLVATKDGERAVKVGSTFEGPDGLWYVISEKRLSLPLTPQPGKNVPPKYLWEDERGVKRVKLCEGAKWGMCNKLVAKNTAGRPAKHCHPTCSVRVWRMKRRLPIYDYDLAGHVAKVKARKPRNLDEATGLYNDHRLHQLCETDRNIRPRCASWDNPDGVLPNTWASERSTALAVGRHGPLTWPGICPKALWFKEWLIQFSYTKLHRDPPAMRWFMPDGTWIRAELYLQYAVETDTMEEKGVMNNARSYEGTDQGSDADASARGEGASGSVL